MKFLPDGRVLIAAEQLRSLYKRVYAVPMPDDCVTEEQVLTYLQAHDLSKTAERIGHPFEDLDDSWVGWDRCQFADELDLKEAGIDDPDENDEDEDDEEGEQAEQVD